MLKHRLAGLTFAVAALAMIASPVVRTTLHAAAPADFVADVVEPYLAIQTALVNDDLAPVAIAAKSLQKSAGALGEDGSALAAAAGKAADARTIEAARAAFADLSTALIAYADKTKVPVEGKIVAFCPMVNKSWVQTDGGITNPYYGKAMTACGSKTRTLSATR